MIESKIISVDAQIHFWHVVICCLVEFHNYTVELANTESCSLLERIEQLPHETIELFYHDEPFNIACRIAKQSLDVVPCLARYLEIRDEPERTH